MVYYWKTVEVNVMLKYPCLVLDHDDTVVMSESTVNYPCFLLVLDRFRPGEYMDPDTFTRLCFDPGFSEMLVEQYAFTEQELRDEFRMWLDYLKTHTPPLFPGIRELVLEQKRRGGKVCVVSHSGHENILRDYREQIGMEPDMIFSWDNPKEQRKPNPYPLHEIMKTYGFQPKDLLMVDDLKPGRDMAVAAGVETAYAGWCRQNVPEIGEIMRSWCDYSFDTVEELYRFLFGAPFLETSRLCIREFVPEDLWDLQEILGDSETMQFSEPPYGLEQTKAFLESFCIARRGALAAVERQSRKLVGYLLFSQTQPGVYELGWFFNRNYWGRGYAFEACKAVMDYAFRERNAQRIFAETIDPGKSLHLMEKLGMKPEGVECVQGRELYVYGLRRTDKKE